MSAPCNPIAELRARCVDKPPAYEIYRSPGSWPPAFVGQCTAFGETVCLVRPGAESGKAARVQLAMLMLEHLDRRAPLLCATVVRVELDEVMATAFSQGSVILRDCVPTGVLAPGTVIGVSIVTRPPIGVVNE